MPKVLQNWIDQHAHGMKFKIKKHVVKTVPIPSSNQFEDQRKAFFKPSGELSTLLRLGSRRRRPGSSRKWQNNTSGTNMPKPGKNSISTWKNTPETMARLAHRLPQRPEITFDADGNFLDARPLEEKTENITPGLTFLADASKWMNSSGQVDSDRNHDGPH